MNPLPPDAAKILVAEIAARIEAARDALEEPALSDSAGLRRGEIRAYRSLLAWIEPPVARPEPEDRRIFPPSPSY